MQTAKDPELVRIERFGIILWLSLVLLGFCCLGRDFAQGVLVGGAVVIVNQHWLYRHTRQALSLPVGQSAGYMTRRYVLRLVTLAAVLFVFIACLHVHVIGLIVGLSVVMLSIVCYACLSYFSFGGN